MSTGPDHDYNLDPEYYAEPYVPEQFESSGEIDDMRHIDANDVVSVCKWLVGHYAEAHNYSTDDLRDKLTIEDLVNHVNKHKLLFDAELEAACIENNIQGIVLDAMVIALANPYSACALLLPIWSMISVSAEPLKVRPVFVAVNVVIGFENEQLLHLGRTGWFDCKKPPLTVGQLMTLARAGFEQIKDDVLVRGVDNLRETKGRPIEEVEEFRSILAKKLGKTENTGG